MDKIKLIRRSIHCFVLGLLGLIPVVGVPFALAAWVYAVATAHKAKGQFNPARRYLSLGRSLGFLGFCVSICICVLSWYIAAHSEEFFPSRGHT